MTAIAGAASSKKDPSAASAPAETSRLGWYDLVFALALLGLGLAFLWNARHWGAMAYIGDQQYGDADFWWQGALQFANGMMWDNLNLTFRMGYAVLTGLFTAALGPNFLLYHKLLCVVFLAVAVMAYLVFRRRLGRITATALAALLVFSPYQATWLAISTSDSTGLVLNLLALLSFLLALLMPLGLRWDGLFGLFLALGGLTRPLMTLFIAPALLLRLLAPGAPWRRRAASVAVAAVAFLLPVAIWVAAYYDRTGNVGLTGYDSSAFYAASDPNIQVWRPDMYPPIEAAAREHYGVTSLNPAQLSAEFWRATFRNYIADYRYHLERIPRTIVSAANFLYEQYNADAHVYTVLRNALLGLLAAFLLFDVVRRNRFGNALALVLLAGLWFGVPAGNAYTIIAFAVLLPLLGPVAGYVPAAVAAYWWTGVAALYLTGGTSGPPIADPFAINALGYRLGSQFFFANDWLVALGFWLAARLRMPHLAVSATSFRPDIQLGLAWERLALSPKRAVSFLLGGGALALVLLLAGLLGLGTVRVGIRAWRLAHIPPVAMPDVAPAVAAFCAGPGGGKVPNPAGPPVVVADETPFVGLTSIASQKLKPEALLATGAVSPLIWHIPTEQRTVALFFQQGARTPFRMTSNRTTVDFSGQLPEASWRNRQGLWLFRRFAEAAPPVGYVFYDAYAQVQAFIPFNGDQSGYALAEATWFPLTQYASALVADGALTVSGGRLDWLTFQSGDVQRRWLILMPSKDAAETGDRRINVALDHAKGKRSLSLSFRVEPIPGNPPPPNMSGVYVEIFGTASGSAAPQRLLAKASRSRGGAVDVPLDRLDVALPPELAAVSVVFHDIDFTEMVRVMELNLVAEDFAPTATDFLCR